ncbi:MAG TPA: DUF6602 domain-containing protein [Candidatus Tectomicrobia bacterium]
MSRPNLGEEDRQILPRFRTVARSYAELFRAQRNHVHELLRGAHNYSSGVFRESLIRNFLTTILPQSISVDSGFVYGFDQIANSRQIDILVWDAMRHAAVYRTREFVIVPPEAVIAAISVKTSLGHDELVGSLENLLSLTPLELMYRSTLDPKSGVPLFRPITKIVVSYEGPANLDNALNTVGKFFQARFAADVRLASEMITALQGIDPIHRERTQAQVYQVERIIPKLIAAIETRDASLFQGWGPPDDPDDICGRVGAQTYGPGLRCLPYMYVQENKLTTPLEKVVYYLLTSTYATLGTSGWSLVAAWGEFTPETGVRVGDASEVIEERGIQLLEPDNLAQQCADEDGPA